MRAWHCLIVLVFAVCASETQAASQVGGGEGYTCAMGVNGRAFCWGLNTSAQMGSGVGAPAQLTVGRPTEMAGGFVTVSNGAFHSCGLQADGLAYCWGNNSQGQLGIGSTQSKSLPSMVHGPSFIAISAGGAHTCAIDTANEVWCWGWNGSEQLARFKSITPLSDVPIQISTNTSNQVLRARAISAGDEHTCAIDMSGAVWCWGQNMNARAGIDINICGGGTTTLCEFARPNLTIASGAQFNLRFTAISAARLNTCGIDTTGTVQCWGTNFRGSALTGRADAPAAVGIGTAVSVSAGGQSTCAVNNSGELFCWGNHENGELGDGTTPAPGAGSITPVRVAGTQDYSSVSVGGTHACARTNGGGARCWGGNTRGELGMSGMGGAKVSAPMTVMGLQSNAITSGHNHVCSQDSANVTACWGDNFYGQVGHGRTTDVPRESVVPTPVGRFYSAPRPGPFPPPPTVIPEELSTTMPPPKLFGGAMQFTDLAVGGLHACALNSAGIAYCWGQDMAGQVGNGKRNTFACRYGGKGESSEGTSCVPNPTIVSRNDSALFADITAGSAHTCGRNQSGVVSCWGSGRYGELGFKLASCTSSACFEREPTQIDMWPNRPNLLDVSAGSGSTCAVNGSEVFCWGSIAGSGTPRSMNFPSGPNYVRATTGAMHACASFPNTAMMCIGLNSFGQFGDGTNNSSWSGTLGAGGMGYKMLAASSMFMCGIDLFGSEVQCWGSNFSGELGDGTTKDSNVPITAAVPLGFAEAVGTGFDHACAISKNAAVQCWGGNAYGQLGDGEVAPGAWAPWPVAAGWLLP